MSRIILYMASGITSRTLRVRHTLRTEGRYQVSVLGRLLGRTDTTTHPLGRVDGSSNKTACGVGVVLEGPGDIFLEQALQFGFRATNNQAEYEALLIGLNLAYDMGAREVTCKSDSQVMVGQVNGEFEVK